MAQQPPPSPEPETEAKPLISFRDVTGTILADSAQAAVDEVTCIALSARLCLVGTKLGSLWRLDTTTSRSWRISANAARINAVSLDGESTMVATGTADGRINVMPLEVGVGEAWVAEHSATAVLSVAICPEYVSGKEPTVCAGGEDGILVQYRRRMMGSGRTVLFAGEGPIQKMVWRSPLLCWTNDFGVKIFNIVTGQKVSFIPRPTFAPNLPPPSGHHLVWADSDHLLMSWGDVVKVGVLLLAGEEADPKTPVVSLANQAKPFLAKVLHEFRTPSSVGGLVPIGKRSLAVLTMDASGFRASVSLYSYGGSAFHTSSVALKGGPSSASRLHLAAVSLHLPFYLIAPRDIVCFELRDLLEYAVSLLNEGRFEEAKRLAQYGGDGVEGLQHLVCLKSILPQLKAADFVGAVDTLRRFHDMAPGTWQECVVLFDRFQGLRFLVDIIPFDPPACRLPREVYDEALQRLVSTPSTLQAVLSWWPSDLFDVLALRAKLNESLQERGEEISDFETLDREERAKVEALAMVEVAAGNLQASAQLYLQLRNPEVFRILRMSLPSNQGLLPLITANIKLLFEIDDQEACTLLVDYVALVPVSTVMEGLEGQQNRWKHEYLKRLFARDGVVGAEYHMQMLEFYAEYEPHALLHFLRSSERYPLDAALEICSSRDLFEEKAYLLGRVGRVNDALKVLLEELGDVGRAVHFAAEYQDPSLWEFLITFVLERPHLIVPLLEQLEDLDRLFGQVGKDSGRAQPPQNAKASHVLRRLPLTTPVSRVAKIIGRIFQSIELLTDVTESCTKLSRQEVREHKKTILHARSRGAKVSPERRRCSVCGCPISRPPPEDAAIVSKLQHSEGVGDVASGRVSASSETWLAQSLGKLEDADATNSAAYYARELLVPHAANAGTAAAVAAAASSSSSLPLRFSSSPAAGAASASSATGAVTSVASAPSVPASASASAAAAAAASSSSYSSAAVGLQPGPGSIIVQGHSVLHARCFEVSTLLDRVPASNFLSLRRSRSTLSDHSASGSF